MFIWEYANQERVKELRPIDTGRFQQQLNTELANYLRVLLPQLVQQKKLIKGTRGGFSLP